ncbi:MAG: S1 RNA-binding domain-containing protein [Clostridia bacterium]|nr:S1 RNA-binding domain-containing protein [Clostridia bacterium]MBQ9848062.1 S1 RNA-binding domain-containing protein [Clostridia bacterium]
MAYSLGETVSGTVSGVVDYGAFVRLEDGTSGMIHISKLSREYVSDIHSVIKKGDVVTATVISVENGKIALSLIGDSPKKCASREERFEKKSEPKDFESMLSSFKSASEEKLAGINRASRGDRERRRRK